MSDIISYIKNNYSNIHKNELEGIAEKLVEYYNPIISHWIRYSYGGGRYEQISPVAISASKKEFQIKIESALNTFIFNKKHYENNRDINSYLRKVIKNTALSSIKFNVTNDKRQSFYACPVCKYYGIKQKLSLHDGSLFCQHCSDELDFILKNSILGIEPKFRFISLFLNHSKKGIKCPHCCRFIPNSSLEKNNNHCAYPDCGKKVEDMTNEKVHPTISLKFALFNIDDETDYNVRKISSASTNGLENLTIKYDIINDLNLLYSVINEQRILVQRSNLKCTKIQKKLMYDAFDNMVKKYPEDMIQYLVNRKPVDFSIQPVIFQEYVNLIENSLPFDIKKNGKIIKIDSVLDSNLALFCGESKYNTEVKSGGVILNETKETYVGRRQFKDYGPCFIGKLIDVIDNNSGQSILKKVKDYTFIKININDVKEGTPVTVHHYRILPHYEMGALVFLQRIRKKIVDSVYFRKFGTKRSAKGKDNVTGKII